MTQTITLQNVSLFFENSQISGGTGTAKMSGLFYGVSGDLMKFPLVFDRYAVTMTRSEDNEDAWTATTDQNSGNADFTVTFNSETSASLKGTFTYKPTKSNTLTLSCDLTLNKPTTETEITDIDSKISGTWRSSLDPTEIVKGIGGFISTGEDFLFGSGGTFNMVLESSKQITKMDVLMPGFDRTFNRGRMLALPISITSSDISEFKLTKMYGRVYRFEITPSADVQASVIGAVTFDDANADKATLVVKTYIFGEFTSYSVFRITKLTEADEVTPTEALKNYTFTTANGLVGGSLAGGILVSGDVQYTLLGKSDDYFTVTVNDFAINGTTATATLSADGTFSAYNATVNTDIKLSELSGQLAQISQGIPLTFTKLGLNTYYAPFGKSSVTIILVSEKGCNFSINYRSSTNSNQAYITGALNKVNKE